MKALVTVLLACSVSTSWAALGGHQAQFGAKAIRQQVQPVATAVTGYTVSQTTLDAGTTVREYVDASGVVFGVSWSGPFLPNLKELLGPYFDQMTSAQERQRQRPQVINQPDVVIQSGGHMGAFQGRAWLTGKLPAGFDPGKDIQ
jgi:hypothetical protein